MIHYFLRLEEGQPISRYLHISYKKMQKYSHLGCDRQDHWIPQGFKLFYMELLHHLRGFH